MKQLTIIEKIAEENILHDIIMNVAVNKDDEDLKDLENDIYVWLLTKYDNDTLTEIYENGQMNFFLTRIITNNIWSKTSPWYYIYKKNNKIMIDIDDWNEEAED